MNCRERKAFISLQEEKDNNEAILRRRITKERAEHKKADKLLDAVCVMLVELGAAAFVYALMSFAHWAEYGF